MSKELIERLRAKIDRLQTTTAELAEEVMNLTNSQVKHRDDDIRAAKRAGFVAGAAWARCNTSTDSLPVAANKFSNGTVGSPPECLQLNQSDISTLHLFKDFIIEYNYCYRLVDAIPAFVKASMVIPDDREYLIMNRLINFIIRNDLSNTIDAAVHMFVESEQ